MYPWLTPWNISDLTQVELQAMLDHVDEMNREANRG